MRAPGPSVRAVIISRVFTFIKVVEPVRILQLPKGTKFWPQGTDSDAGKLEIGIVLYPGVQAAGMAANWRRTKRR